jgi:hypothetical protein
MSKPHISNPCHEKWDDMTPQSGGRYCDECNKTVIDFTGKSEVEISEFLSEHSGIKVCGRFSANQVVLAPKRMHLQLHKLYLNASSIKVTTIRSISVFLIGLLMVLMGCSTSPQSHEVDGMLERSPAIDVKDSADRMLLGEVEVDYTEDM